MCARTLCSRLSVLTILISYWEVSQMDTNSNNFISLRVSRRATNKKDIIGLFGGLAVAGNSPSPRASAAVRAIAYKSRPNILQPSRRQLCHRCHSHHSAANRFLAVSLTRSVRTSLVAVFHEVLPKSTASA